jgi:hypothetical protein
MKLKVKIGDDIHEVERDAIELPENIHFLTPDSVPKGYFTQAAFDQKIAEITRSKLDKARTELESDNEFHKQILGKYNINIGEDGKPTGLKSDFDPEKWKSEQARKLTEPLEQEKAKLSEQLERFKVGMKKAEILKHATGLFKPEYVQSFTGQDDPFVVKQFGDAFDIDENGMVALKDTDGTFAVDNTGGRITPDKYFKSNADKFATLLADQRQRGPGAGGGTPAGGRFTDEQIEKMSDKEYEANREAILGQLK